MKIKIIFLILAISLIGIIQAATLENVEGMNIPLNIFAGDSVQANFSFDYACAECNPNNWPMILEINISSNDSSFPVWKNDFQINGYVEKCSFGTVCLFPAKIYFNCSEIAPLKIEHSIATYTIHSIPAGTFYCYNEDASLNLKEHNTIFLNISSAPSLWPGQYNLSTKIYYLDPDCEDEKESSSGGSSRSYVVAPGSQDPSKNSMISSCPAPKIENGNPLTLS